MTAMPIQPMFTPKYETNPAPEQLGQTVKQKHGMCMCLHVSSSHCPNEARFDRKFFPSSFQNCTLSASASDSIFHLMIMTHAITETQLSLFEHVHTACPAVCSDEHVDPSAVKLLLCPGCFNSESINQIDHGCCLCVRHDSKKSALDSGCIRKHKMLPA